MHHAAVINHYNIGSKKHQRTPSLRRIRNIRTRASIAAPPNPVPSMASSPKSTSSPCSQASSCSPPNLGGPKKPSTLLRRCSNVIKATPLGFNSACVKWEESRPVEAHALLWELRRNVFGKEWKSASWVSPGLHLLASLGLSNKMSPVSHHHPSFYLL